MRDVTVLTEADLRACVPLDSDAVDVVEDAFRALAGGGVEMPPILSMAIPDKNGEVDVKTAYIPGFAGFAIKVSPGFFDNPKRGLPSLNGLMILLSADTGLVEALLLDNGYLTDLRTAAAGATAARHLASDKIETAGVLGAGVQARLQMQALALVRPFERCLVWGRDPEKAQACADDIAAATGARAEAVSSAETAVRESGLVVTTTPAGSPILKADWLHPGLHVTAMGSDAPNKNEIEPEALRRADLFVCDRVSQSVKQGELRSAIAAGVFGADDSHVELGEIVARRRLGRQHENQISICDLTGTGAQDTAIATHALARAQADGRGRKIET